MKDFGAAMDELNNVWMSVEAYFCDLNLGVSAEVPLAVGDRRVLRFSREKDEWVLSILETGSTYWSPILNASREVRVLAASRVSALEEALLAKTKVQYEAVKTASETLRSFLRERGA
jgi:hypothetical protein